MTLNTKKILIQEEIIATPVGAFFQGLGYVLSSEYLPEEQYEFVYGDFELEETSTPRVKFEDECFFESSGSHLLKADSKFFNDPITNELIKRFFQKSYSFFNLEELKSTTIVNLKMQDYLNLGFFVDSIVINGHKNNYNILKLRFFLNEMCDILFHKIDSAFNSAPIEVNYCFDEDSFKIHFEFTCHQIDILKEELVEKQILHMSNLSELIILKRRSRAIFKCVFFKDHKLNQVHAFSVKELGAEEEQIVAHEFDAISGLEDHGYLSFNELGSDEFLEKINLGESELSELVQYFSSENSENDAAQLISGTPEDQEMIIHAIKSIEAKVEEKLKVSGNMSLSELKSTIHKEFEASKREQAQVLFDRVIDQLKKNKAESEKAANDKNSEPYRLKVSLQKSIDLIKNKDALIKKIKRDAEIKSNYQKQEIKILEAKLKNLRVDLSETKNRVEDDVRSLASSADDSILADSPSSLDDQSAQIVDELKKEIKQGDENLKKAQIEIKRLEQKLKFSNSQFDSLMKKKNVVPKGVTKANFDLLRDNETLKASLRKLEQEVAEKKTESFRFKQDNSILSNKLSELEKKLAYAEKKAS